MNKSNFILNKNFNTVKRNVIFLPQNAPKFSPKALEAQAPWKGKGDGEGKGVMKYGRGRQIGYGWRGRKEWEGKGRRVNPSNVKSCVRIWSN